MSFIYLYAYLDIYSILTCIFFYLLNLLHNLYTYLKELKTTIQLGKLVRFLYHSISKYTKRGTSVAALGKALDNKQKHHRFNSR